MINRLFLIGVVLWVFSFCPLSFAADVTATGEGNTRQEAINNAIRNATEQALGASVDSKTMINKGELIYDKISTASAGYVKGYDVIAEGKDPIGETYKVKIRVTIDDFKLKNVVSEFMNDPRAQRTFQETKFDDRRIIVLYKPQAGTDLPYDSKAVRIVMTLINDRLSHHAFRVFLQDDLQRIKGKMMEKIVDSATAIDLGRQEQADAVVSVSFEASSRKTADGFYNIEASTTIETFDVTTAELFANIREKDKTIAMGDEQGYLDGIATVAEKVGPRAVDLLTEKIIERFSTKRAKSMMVVFNNLPQQVMDKVEDIMDKIGWKYRISKQTGEYMEVEVFSEGDPTSVRSTLRKEFKREGLPLSSAEMIGSRVVFDGKKK